MESNPVKIPEIPSYLILQYLAGLENCISSRRSLTPAHIYIHVSML